MTTTVLAAPTLAQMLEEPGSGFPGDCLQLIVPEIVEADCIGVALFAVGRDRASNNFFALGVIRTVYGGLFPAFCFRCDGIWHLREAQPGDWISQWIRSHPDDVWTGSLKAAGLFLQIVATSVDEHVKVFQPEPGRILVSALIQQFIAAQTSDGYTHVVRMGVEGAVEGTLYSLGAAVSMLHGYNGTLSLVINSHKVVILPTSVDLG